MVPISPGYSVPVVVPEQAQPGMVIPVTMPNPSYGQNPMMHSPVMGYRQNAGPYGQQQQQQQQAYAAPAPQPHTQIHLERVEKKDDGPLSVSSTAPAAGSWAAKAAAQPSKN